MSPSSSLAGHLRFQAARELVLRWMGHARESLRACVPVTDHIAVTLYPDRLLLARVRGMWQPKLVHQQEIALPQPGPGTAAWLTAMDALGELIANGVLAQARVSVVLSSQFVYYTVVPWNPLLNSEAEQKAYATQRLVRVHGDVAQTWRIRLSRAVRGQARVVCAVPSALLDALDAVMKPIGRRFVSVQPHLIVCFNQWARQLDERPRWFAVAEPGQLCLAFLHEGQWHSIRALRFVGTSPEEFGHLLHRERMLSEAIEESELVTLVGAPVAALRSGAWNVENLTAGKPARRVSRERLALAAVIGV